MNELREKIKRKLFIQYNQTIEQLLIEALVKNNIDPKNLQDIRRNCRAEQYLLNRETTYFYKDIKLLTIKEPNIYRNETGHVITVSNKYLHH